MTKTLVISPLKYRQYNGILYGNVYIKIELDDAGELQLTGVEFPMSNGNCRGSCGQINMHYTPEYISAIPTEDFNPGWTRLKLAQLIKTWDSWHLNHMRPYCQHQKQLGWDKIATTKVNLYTFTQTTELIHEKNRLEKDTFTALQEGKTVTLSEDERRILSLPYSITSHLGQCPEGYKLDKTESKTLGWLYPKDHPDGILTKPCPECGYKYGSAWQKEQVPAEVINWLFNLPPAETRPAWI